MPCFFVQCKAGKSCVSIVQNISLFLLDIKLASFFLFPVNLFVCFSMKALKRENCLFSSVLLTCYDGSELLSFRIHDSVINHKTAAVTHCTFWKQTHMCAGWIESGWACLWWLLSAPRGHEHQALTNGVLRRRERKSSSASLGHLFALTVAVMIF